VKAQSYIDQIPEIAPVLANADHLAIKTTISDKSMREFIAGMFGYQPGWVTLLYGVRMAFVRFLGMQQKGIPRALRLEPETVPMTPGQRASFFRVRTAEDERYWFAEIDDTHLKAALGVVVEPLAGNQRRFHVVTVVHYHNWAGPVYFNVIRPFHHLVVGGMVRAGTQ
jgi:hypothetical protein